MRIRAAIAVPVLNEAEHIGACLQSLLDQHCACDILVLDGGSTDATPALLAGWAQRHPCIHIYRNPQRLQSAAINLAAEIAPSGVSVLLRADAHAVYPPEFTRLCLEALQAHGATSVVVPMRNGAAGGFQVAVAAAQGSRLGNGGAAHRSPGVSRFVEHGHHAAFDLAFFRRIGGYDQRFSHNEDAEHDIRAVAAGGRIWMCMEAAVTYVPRATPGDLARQYRNHGHGRACTLLRHRLWPRPRQMLPLAALACVAGGLLLIPMSPWFSAAPLGYAALCLGWGLLMAARARDPLVAAAGAAAIIMHLSWAVGFVGALLQSAAETCCRVAERQQQRQHLR